MYENLKAFELWDKGEYSEAIQVLFNQIEENPENMASYYNLANMLLVAKKEEDAKAVLLVANEKSPNHPEILYAFGTYYYQIEDYPQGIHAFLAVFQQDTYLKKDSLVMIAQCYIALGNPQKALVYLLTAEEIDGTDSDVLIVMGNTFMQIEDYKQAQEYFKKVTEVTPKNAEAWFKRGLTSLVLNEEKKLVESYFNQSMELDPVFYQKNRQQLAEIQAFIQKNEG